MSSGYNSIISKRLLNIFSNGYIVVILKSVIFFQHLSTSKLSKYHASNEKNLVKNLSRV